MGDPKDTPLRACCNVKGEGKKSFTSFAIVLAAQASHLHCILALLLAKSSSFLVFGLVFAFALHSAFPLATGSSEPLSFGKQSLQLQKQQHSEAKRKNRSSAKLSPPRDSVCDVSIDSSAFCDIQPGARLAQATRRSPKKSSLSARQQISFLQPAWPFFIHCKLAPPEAYHRRQPQLRPRHWRNTSSGDSAHLQRPSPNCPSIQSERCVALSHGCCQFPAPGNTCQQACSRHRKSHPGHAIPGRRRILSVAASNRYVVFLSCSNFGLVSSLFCFLMPSSPPSSLLLVAAATSPGSSIYLLGNILSLLGRTKSP